jgi:hypothetical protein
VRLGEHVDAWAKAFDGVFETLQLVSGRPQPYQNRFGAGDSSNHSAALTTLRSGGHAFGQSTRNARSAD